jgi:dipeptidyl aminopeptidase/acylaminoacyl peptidase
MADLDERFRSLSRTGSPDLWPDIETREPRSAVPPTPWPHRALAAAVALVIAVAGIALAALSFGGAEHQPSTGTSGSLVGPKANGEIWFRVGGGEGGSRIEAAAPDGSGRRVVFEEEPTRIAQVAWSPDGTRIAYQNPIADERGIFVANPDGSDAVRLTEGANDAWPSWSPDGTRIAFSSTRYDPAIEPCAPAGLDAGCPTDIYLMDVDGSNVSRVTRDPAAEYRATWSPDGTLMAFERNTSDLSLIRPAIFTMRPDGSDVRQVSSGDGGSDFAPSWSPDGSRIAFAAIRREDWGIWTVDANGQDERMVLGGADAGYVDNPVWSPDGSLIAFVGNLEVDDYSPDDALYVMRPDGTGVTPLADAPGIGVAGDIAWQPIPAAEPTPPPDAPLPTSAEVVETFDVGDDVRSVAFGENSVWVAVSNNDGNFGGRILRIDPITHEVQAEIPVDAIPGWEVGGGAMAFDGGDLWVAGDVEMPGAFDDPGGGADAAVVRIETATNEVVSSLPLGGSGAADLTFLDGELWVLVFGDETVDHRMEVVRVDPTTGDVTSRIPLDTKWAHTIVEADGRLVVLESGPGAANAAGHAAVIHPATNRVSRAEVPGDYLTPMPVVSRREVWISLDPGFARLDPLSVAFPERVQLPSRFSACCGFLEADDRGIWFIDLAVNADRALSLFDPASGEARELIVVAEGTPVAMAVAPDSVWILNYEGTLTHVTLG